jgi:hypothetical protein
MWLFFVLVMAEAHYEEPYDGPRTPPGPPPPRLVPIESSETVPLKRGTLGVRTKVLTNSFRLRLSSKFKRCKNKIILSHSARLNYRRFEIQQGFSVQR